MPYRRDDNIERHGDGGMRCTITRPRYALALLIACAVCFLFADDADARGHMRDASAVRAVMQWHSQHDFYMGDVRRVRRGHGGDGWTLVDVRYEAGEDTSGAIDVTYNLVDVFYVRPAGNGYAELKEPETWPRVWRFKLWRPTSLLDKQLQAMGTDQKERQLANVPHSR